jgi:hypothetical protein
MRLADTQPATTRTPSDLAKVMADGRLAQRLVAAAQAAAAVHRSMRLSVPGSDAPPRRPAA